MIVPAPVSMSVNFDNLSFFFLQLMVDGLNGPFSHAMLRVDQDNETEHELAQTHPHRVAEVIVWDLPWKR